MASFNFNAGIRGIVTGAIDLDTDTFWAMLLTGTALGETEKDGFDFRNDIVTEHGAATGYTQGGKVCTLTVAAVDGPNNDVEVTLAPITWSTATITNATGLVVYKRRGGASSADEVLCYVDFNGAVSSTGADFVFTPSSTMKFQN